MKKYLFLAMATMMAAACSHPTADKTTQVVESSRLTAVSYTHLTLPTILRV